MWASLASKMLRNRLVFAGILFLLTLLMGFWGSRIQLSYEFARVLPSGDSSLVHYEQFKKTFGEDGSVMVLGFEDQRLFERDRFNRFYELSESIRRIDGVKQVLSLSNIFEITRNDSLSRFDLVQLMNEPFRSDSAMMAFREKLNDLPFFKGRLYNDSTGAVLLAVTFNDKALNSARRLDMVRDIEALGREFGKEQGVGMHFSGMPYIRTVIMKKVSSEMTLFMILAIVVMAATLWVFFRSFSSVLLSLVVVIIGVVWSLGLIYLFGYRITLLSGLIPPLIMVIGVPNCVFLINKYHAEYARHRNKMKALSRTIQTIGVTLFLANITTAIGFGVLYFTGSSLLVEFGNVAAIAVMTTYIITLILIPIVLSYMPGPRDKHTRHLEAPRINAVLKVVDHLVQHKRAAIYSIIGACTVVSIAGMSRINIISFVVDDLPKNDPVYADMRFFESSFHGVLPLEILIDTRSESGLMARNGEVLYKINRLQKVLGRYEEFSRPLSIVEVLKFSNQAMEGGDPRKYILPGYSGLQQLSSYTGGSLGKEGLLRSLVDSTRQFTRISLQVADIGSKRMNTILEGLKPSIDSVFSPDRYSVEMTGHSVIFMKSNDYLLKNLLESLLIEILLITLVGLALFRSLRIILLSKLPCLIPLVITAGIMGFFNISFRPSTILIFSIAFGISSDGTIYFLTRFKQELKNKAISVPQAISITIRETGISMVYTTIILFFGFAIFAASGFGGTVALGILLSVTLFVAMITNLMLLPSILLSIDKRQSRREMLQTALIEIEEEDEDK